MAYPHTGLGQQLDWGTSTTIAYSVGQVTGGSIDYNSNPFHSEGIGAQDKVHGGPVEFTGNATFIVQESSLIAYAKRTGTTAPSLTELCFAGGYGGVGQKQTGCKIDSLRASCSIGQPLTATVAWKGLDTAAYAADRQAVITKTDYMWFTGTCTAMGASLTMQAFDMELRNNLTSVYSLDAHTDNEMRWPDSIQVGDEELTFGCDVLARVGTEYTDLVADTLGSAFTASLAFHGGTAGTQTLTIALSNLHMISAPIPFSVGGGLITYRLELGARKNQGSITITEA